MTFTNFTKNTGSFSAVSQSSDPTVTGTDAHGKGVSWSQNLNTWEDETRTWAETSAATFTNISKS